MQAAFTPAYGPADIIEVREVPQPVIGAKDVLIAVQASPVTAGDRRVRAADFPSFTVIPGRLLLGISKPSHPVQGTMFAGRVVEVGEAVTRFAVGDDVFGSADHGAWAEAMVVSEDGGIARIPDGFSYAEAAAIPYGAGTALHFLRDLAGLQAGESVLILGASGGVGRYATQLASSMGAEVTAVCSRDDFELVRQLGAREVLDYRSQDFTENGLKYDVIFDIADASSFSHSRASLTPKGRYLTLYMSTGALFWMGWTALTGGAAAKVGVAMGGDMTELAELLASGAVRPMVAQRFGLQDIVAAHQEAASGRLHGEIIVEVAGLA